MSCTKRVGENAYDAPSPYIKPYVIEAQRQNNLKDVEVNMGVTNYTYRSPN